MRVISGKVKNPVSQVKLPVMEFLSTNLILVTLIFCTNYKYTIYLEKIVLRAILGKGFSIRLYFRVNYAEKEKEAVQS